MQKVQHTIGEAPIAATVYLPAKEGKYPVVVLCHGFCGVQDLLLPQFAEAFAHAGYAAVTFDYRGFGRSGGDPGRLVPALQIEDILEVVRWVRTREELDGERIGLWGTSLGGGHVMGAAMRTEDIRCIVSQLAFADGKQVVAGAMSHEEKLAFADTLERMQAKKESTGRETMVSLPRVLSDEQSKAFYEKYRADHPSLDIKIPFLTVREMFRYRPAETAAQVTCPTLVIVAGRDKVNPPEQGIALYEASAAAEKALHVEETATHYDLYEGDHFDRAVTLQLDWFERHLRNR
ncbi:UilS family quorum-quenching N-acyl-homoserine lactonase [Dyella mobilis]|uniref:Alpha/beta fold hydrolase n=1 Tax=Dyella mobilis TaxID=1849582 RepID=A0ABS2KET4_9GAMM|nr:alpha/beta fold hydrolase [Dyella mobilis]MBM7129662.1 alpha/beta fold hydrolase [Dyella mobilis]GLQ98072.1 alpha/beta hydrolase [Dyella mobilis]